MWIRRVRFEGFGRFNRGLDMTLGPGLNLVVGPNESGKSTIVEGVIGVIFGLKDREAEAALRPRGIHGAYTGELELVDGDSEIHLARDFESHRVLVTRKTGGRVKTLYQGEANPRGRTDDLLAYLAVIEELFGFSDRDTALRSLFVRQGEVETAADERLRQLLSGAAVGDYDTVLERLEEKFAALTRENPWGRRRNQPRQLEQLDESILNLSERLGRAREALAQGGRVGEAVETIAADLRKARQEAAQREQAFQNFDNFFSINKERGELEKRLRTLRDEKEKVKELAADCQRVEAELWPRFEVFREAGPDFPDALRNLANLQRDLQLLGEDLSRREAQLAQVPAPRNFRRGLVIGAIGAAVVTAALLGAGLGMAALVIGPVAGVLAGVAFYLLGKGRELGHVRLEGQIVELEERIEKLEKEIDTLEESLRPFMMERRVKDVLELYRDFREKFDLLSRYEQIRDSHRPLPVVEEDYDSVFQKLRLADAQARDLIALAPYLAGLDEDLNDAALRLEKARGEKEESDSRVASLEAGLEELKLRQARQEGAPAEDVEALEEELAEARERRERLLFLKGALSEAIEVLRGCVTEFQGGHGERLAGRAGEIFRRVTGGHYPLVTLDRNFAPTVTAADDEVFQPAQLSRGTRDQLYLALRLAVAQELGPDRNLPVVMDDALVNCDADRLQAIRRLVDDATAGGRQIFILTHDPSYREWGGTINVLDAVPFAEGAQAVGTRSAP